MRWLVLLLCACKPPQAPFAMPRNVEDARGRLLAAIPEGRDIAGARDWMAAHAFRCDAPMPSATDAHAHVCRPADPPADAGWRAWTIVLFERGGRLADVQVR